MLYRQIKLDITGANFISLLIQPTGFDFPACFIRNPIRNRDFFLQLVGQFHIYLK
jgi:hypothetical protein